MGHKMDSTGGMLVKDNDQPIQQALAFKYLLSDAAGNESKYGYMVLYKGRFQEFSETFQTVDRNGDIKFQTHSGLKGTFVRRDADGHLMYRMREDTPSYSTTKASAVPALRVHAAFALIGASTKLRLRWQLLSGPFSLEACMDKLKPSQSSGLWRSHRRA